MSAALKYIGRCSATPATLATKPAQKATGWGNVMAPAGRTRICSYFSVDVSITRSAQWDPERGTRATEQRQRHLHHRDPADRAVGRARVVEVPVLAIDAQNHRRFRRRPLVRILGAERVPLDENGFLFRERLIDHGRQCLR